MGNQLGSSVERAVPAEEDGSLNQDAVQPLQAPRIPRACFRNQRHCCEQRCCCNEFDFCLKFYCRCGLLRWYCRRHRLCGGSQPDLWTEGLRPCHDPNGCCCHCWRETMYRVADHQDGLLEEDGSSSSGSSFDSCLEDSISQTEVFLLSAMEKDSSEEELWVF